MKPKKQKERLKENQAAFDKAIKEVHDFDNLVRSGTFHRPGSVKK